jgi:hypothetical protein
MEDYHAVTVFAAQAGETEKLKVTMRWKAIAVVGAGLGVILLASGPTVLAGTGPPPTSLPAIPLVSQRLAISVTTIPLPAGGSKSIARYPGGWEVIQEYAAPASSYAGSIANAVKAGIPKATTAPQTQAAVPALSGYTEQYAYVEVCYAANDGSNCNYESDWMNGDWMFNNYTALSIWQQQGFSCGMFFWQCALYHKLWMTGSGDNPMSWNAEWTLGLMCGFPNFSGCWQVGHLDEQLYLYGGGGHNFSWTWDG